MAYLTYRKKLYQIKLYLFVYECNNKANKMKCFLTIHNCKKHMLSFYLTYMIPYLFYFYFFILFFLLFIILCFIFQLPSSEEQWKTIADKSDRRCNFPHCIGALDGKHVVIQRPENTVGEFYNYEGTEGIILLAIVEANYCFIYVNVGCQGHISDGSIFRNTEFDRKLKATTCIYHKMQHYLAGQYQFRIRQLLMMHFL